MKIGIFSLILHTNYGGILQAWALQTVLEKLGHEAHVLHFARKEYHPAVPLWHKWMYSVSPRIMNRINGDSFRELERRSFLRGNKRIFEFVRHRVNHLEVGALNEIAAVDCDAIVVGSDQIWRPEYFTYLWESDDPSGAFLAGNIPSGSMIFSYAASLGVDKWLFSTDETEKIAKALREYKAVSVREISAVDVIRESTGVIPTFVLDPTMLLTPEEYVEILGLHPKKNGGIVSYILDPDERTQSLIDNVAQHRKLQHTELNAPDKKGYMPSVENWIESIASADIVVTDSFHGCVFSLIFRKPLVFLLNPGRGNARFDSIIKTFGLDRNLVAGPESYDISFDYSLPADIDCRIEKLRSFSARFLKNALSNS